MFNRKMQEDREIQDGAKNPRQPIQTPPIYKGVEAQPVVVRYDENNDDANFDSYKFGNNYGETAAVPQTQSTAVPYQQTLHEKTVDSTKQHFYHQVSVIGGSNMPG